MTIQTLEIIHKHLRDEMKGANQEYEEALAAVRGYESGGERATDEMIMRVHQARKVKDRARGTLIQFETQDFR